MMRGASRGGLLLLVASVMAFACSPAQTPTSSGDVTLTPLAAESTATAAVASASASTVVAPPPSAGPPGSVPDAGFVIASLSKGFRGCWVSESAVAGGSAEATGNVKMVLDREGRVTTATASGFNSPSLASCLESVGLAAKFAA
ncbi:MAG: hypothetical protein JNK04_13550, partial [Myxococcales bacterium]|nr:hypothetical protein [Myxococcales bacterium]